MAVAAAGTGLASQHGGRGQPLLLLYTQGRRKEDAAEAEKASPARLCKATIISKWIFIGFVDLYSRAIILAELKT